MKLWIQSSGCTTHSQQLLQNIAANRKIILFATLFAEASYIDDIVYSSLCPKQASAVKQLLHHYKREAAHSIMFGSRPTLLSLPAEIRLHVFSFLFNEVVTIETIVTCSGVTKERQVSKDYPTALSKTCTQLRDESVPMYYGHIKIYTKLRSRQLPVGLIRYLHTIGQENARLLRRFQLRWSDYVDISFEITRHALARFERIEHKDLEYGSTPHVKRLLRNMEMPNSEAMMVPVSLSTRRRRWVVATPPSMTRAGKTHILTVEGVRYHNCGDSSRFWRLVNTPRFCEEMSQEFSDLLGALLDGGLQLGI